MVLRLLMVKKIATLVFAFVFAPVVAIAATAYTPVPADDAYVDTETITAILDIDEATCDTYGDGTWGLRIYDGSNWFNGDARDCASPSESWVPSDFVRDGGGAGFEYGDLVEELSVAGYSGGGPNSTIGTNVSGFTSVWDYTPTEPTSTQMSTEWTGSMLLGLGMGLFLLFGVVGYRSLV